jgi:hypothetical protein
METKLGFVKVMLFAIMVGLWVLVLQNFGVFHSSSLNVKVVGGRIDTISNNLNVKGNVDVNNELKVDINSIHGNPNAFYGQNGKFDAIHVYTGF